MTNTDLKILQGCLGSPRAGMRIGFFEGCWVLSTNSDQNYVILCYHRNWDEFMKLVREYSDYVEGE